MPKLHEAPLADEALDLICAAMTGNELTYRAMRELMTLTDAEWLPLEREARRRWERDDLAGYLRYLREQRKRRTAGSDKPAA